MLRKIVAFAQDEVGDWKAELDCGHYQHTRHQPPFFPCPWVITEEGRQEHLGEQLDCLRCDQQEIPDNFTAYKQTPIFNQQTIPDGLKANHSTKTGIWGIIRVFQGKLIYRIAEPFNSEEIIQTNQTGIVIPEVSHSVTPFANTQFLVEFWQKKH